MKSGTGRIDGVLSPGERVDRKGLIFAATPASDFICGTRNSLAERSPDLIGVNAGRVASGEASIEEIGWEIFRLILDCASGRKKTWAEKWGIHNDLCLFNPAPAT